MRLLGVLVFLIGLIGVSRQQSNNSILNDMIKRYENIAQKNGRIFRVNYDGGYTPTNGYDFIIVGSGSAGAAVANRLSENPNWNILLLEVGEDPSILTDIPAFAPAFQFTNYNWGYLMEKQDNFGGSLKDQRMHWPRGRVLGGTSVINYMIHVRGNRNDYDRWERMGNPGWSYKDVLPLFKRSEDSTVKIQDYKYHSRGGALSVEDVAYRSESCRAFVAGAQEAGYPYVDYNGENQIGISYVQATTKNGKRCSAEKAYLRPARSRPNLTILTKSRATKILIDPKTRTAYGIEYIKNRRYHIAKASKEVILSAGAFNSPQILMLSGIGPKDHLEELGIPVVKNLPVGVKMYDHLTFLGLMFKVNQSITFRQEEVESPATLIQYILSGTGPLTSLGGVEALGYLKTNVSHYPENYPDMELIFIGGGLQTDRGLYYKNMFRVSDEVYNKIWKPLEGQSGWSVYPMLLHPKSYGYLRLKSKNPFHWPKFYGNYFTDPENKDIKAFIVAIREVQRIARSPSLQKYGSQQVTTPIPGCEQHRFDSDPYWECALRSLSATLHHQVATCKMGPSTDREAVVDPRLRVYGIKNLRVADTSIIPTPVSAHTNVPAYMVGEKASDLIKEDWLGERRGYFNNNYS